MSLFPGGHLTIAGNGQQQNDGLCPGSPAPCKYFEMPSLILPTTSTATHSNETRTMGKGLLSSPPLICEQGPSAPSSPTSPGGSKLRRPSPLTADAMHRINLLGLPGFPPPDCNKLCVSPGYATSDLGSSPRSSISVHTGQVGPWTMYRDKNSIDFDDGASDVGKDGTHTPGLMYSPAPYSPFSDYAGGVETPYLMYARSPLHSPTPNHQLLHFSFDPIRSASSMSNRAHQFLQPTSSFDESARERSRSDGEMSKEDDEKMDTTVQSTISVPATSGRHLSQSGQYKKRLLYKYQEEQKLKRLQSQHRSSSSPPPSTTESDADDLDLLRSISRAPSRQPSRQASRQPTIEEPPPSPPPTNSNSVEDLATAVKNALGNAAQFNFWMRGQLMALNLYQPGMNEPSPGLLQVPQPAGLGGSQTSLTVPQQPILQRQQTIDATPTTASANHGPIRHKGRLSRLSTLPSLISQSLSANYQPYPFIRRYSYHIPKDEQDASTSNPTLWRRSRSESDVSGNGCGTGAPVRQTGPQLAGLSPSQQFVCPHCGQAFALHDRLAKHIASRHRDRSNSTAEENCKTHKCTVCSKSFGRSDMLTRHMRLHTGVKPYGCQVCGQVFSRSDHLSTHARTHTGEKPYQCPICNYAASRRDMITRHMKTHTRPDGSAYEIPDCAVMQGPQGDDAFRQMLAALKGTLQGDSSSNQPSTGPTTIAAPLATNSPNLNLLSTPSLCLSGGSSPTNPSVNLSGSASPNGSLSPNPGGLSPGGFSLSQASLLGSSLSPSTIGSGAFSAFHTPTPSSNRLAPPTLMHSLSTPSSPMLQRQSSIGGYNSQS